MNLKTLVNMVLLVALAYVGYSGYQYWQLGGTIISELKGQQAI